MACFLMCVRRAGLVCLAALVAVCALPTAATAQSRAELAEARELFTQGTEAAHDRRWIEARDFFERSLAITERASTLLNLAAALAETGALVESAERYERFLEVASRRDRRRRGAEARRAIELVRERTPRLELDGSALNAGDAVEVDGRAVAEEARQSPLLLDPGSHHVTVQRDGQLVFEAHITLAEGGSESLPLEPRAVPDPSEVAASEVQDRDPALLEEGGGGDDDGLAIGIGVGAGAAVLVAVAIVLAVVLTSEAPPNYEGNLGGGVIRY